MARTAAQTDLIVNVIRQALLSMPDLRLGQLIENATPLHDGFRSDLFYVADIDLCDSIRKYVNSTHGQITV